VTAIRVMLLDISQGVNDAHLKRSLRGRNRGCRSSFSLMGLSALWKAPIN
jgi:hypothetical protein